MLASFQSVSFSATLALPPESLTSCSRVLSFSLIENKNLPELRSRIRNGFYKDVDPEEPLPEDSGFWKDTKARDTNIFLHPLKNVIQELPRDLAFLIFGRERDLQLMEGLNTSLENYTAKRGARKRLGPVSMFLGSLLLLSPTFPIQARLFDEGLQQAANLYGDALIMKDWSAWGETVKYDFRQEEARAVLNEGGSLSPLKAREVAYATNLVYKDFRTWLVSQRGHPDPDVRKLEASTLFSHIQALKLYMSGQSSLFFVIKPGEMTIEQERTVISLDEALYINYDTVSVWAHAGAPRDLSSFGPSFRKNMQPILDDPFTQELLAIRDNDPSITNLVVQFFVQQDLADQRDFKVRKLLGLVPYLIKDGQPTGELNLYSLEDLRSQTRDKIQKHQDLP